MDNAGAMEVIPFLESNRMSDFEQFFHEWYPKLCAYAHRFVEIDKVEDVVQECMVWLWEKRSEVQIRGSVQSYLFSMVRNRCLNYISRNRLSEKAAAYYFNSLKEKSDESFGDFDAVELRRRIDKAIANLPESYRIAFLKHREEGLTYRQIAEQSNVSVKTIDYRIQQSLKLLRKELSDFLPIEAVLIIMSFLNAA